MTGLDLSEPAHVDTGIEWWIVRLSGAPVRLSEAGGTRVAQGVQSGAAPLPPGERLVRRTVQVTYSGWEEIGPG